MEVQLPGNRGRPQLLLIVQLADLMEGLLMPPLLPAPGAEYPPTRKAWPSRGASGAAVPAARGNASTWASGFCYATRSAASNCWRACASWSKSSLSKRLKLASE